MSKDVNLIKFLKKICKVMMEGELNKSRVEMTDFLTNKMKFEITDIPCEVPKLRHLYAKNVFEYKVLNIN